MPARCFPLHLTRCLPTAFQRKTIRLLKRGGSHQGVLSCLPRGDRAGCDLVGCSQRRTGANRSGICHALYAGQHNPLEIIDSAKAKADIAGLSVLHEMVNDNSGAWLDLGEWPLVVDFGTIYTQYSREAVNARSPL